MFLMPWMNLTLNAILKIDPVKSDPEHQSTHKGYEVPEDEGKQDDMDPYGEPWGDEE